MTKQTYKVRVPWFAPFPYTREALKVFEGEPKKRVRSLIKTLFSQRGSIKQTVDWTAAKRMYCARSDKN